MTFVMRQEEREYYLPGDVPSIVRLPKMNFLAVQGEGDPAEDAYRQAVALLCAAACAVQDAPETGRAPASHGSYETPPLERLYLDKKQWLLLLRLPDHVTKREFDRAAEQVEQDCGGLEFFTYQEGWCVQCMHHGPCDDVSAEVLSMEAYAASQGYEMDLSGQRYHHEIYLSGPDCPAEERRTVLRRPVRLSGQKDDVNRLSEPEEQLYDVEQMQAGIQAFARQHGFSQMEAALDFAVRHHARQYRRGKTHVPYIYHPLMVACQGIALGLREDDLLAAALLHDVCEDCGVAFSELPVGDSAREIVRLLTKNTMPGESAEEAKKRYYAAIAGHPQAAVIKILDRCHNISGVATGFSRRKMVNYILETEKYVLPLLETARENYPRYSGPLFAAGYHLKSVLETLKAMLERKN